MGFFGCLRKGIDLAMLRGDAADEVAADPESFLPAMAIFTIPALFAGVILALLVHFLAGMAEAGHASAIPPQLALFLPVVKKLSWGIVVLLVLTALVSSLLWVGLLHLIAKTFRGEGKYLDYYQAIGVGSLVSWGGIIPYIGFLFSLWTIVVSVVVTSRVHRLSTGKAAAVVLLPLAVAFAGGIALAVMLPLMLAHSAG